MSSQGSYLGFIIGKLLVFQILKALFQEGLFLGRLIIFYGTLILTFFLGLSTTPSSSLLKEQQNNYCSILQ